MTPRYTPPSEEPPRQFQGPPAYTEGLSTSFHPGSCDSSVEPGLNCERRACREESKKKRRSATESLQRRGIYNFSREFQGCCKRLRIRRPASMKSTRTFARKETAVVFTAACILIVALSTASGQAIDRCGPSSVMECFAMYMDVLGREELKPSPEGEYDQAELKKACSLMKEKLPCHQYLANCSEGANGGHSIQERGYEALRDIICDVNTLKESNNAIKCITVEKMEECVKALMPTSNPEDAGKPAVAAQRCNKNPVEIACFDKAFNSSCPLSMKAAKTAVTRVVNTARQLRGCESSANAVGVSRGFLVLVVVPVILTSLRT
ncbi:hypothetical protein MTO96_036466 [Rhipicephalus appendiculatus]